MTEYTDVMGNTHQITNTVLLTEEEKKRLETEIVEELYQIFMRR